jgi:hypothetical protein
MNSDAAKRICLLAQQNRRGIVQNIFTVFTRFSYGRVAGGALPLPSPLRTARESFPSSSSSLSNAQ